MLLNLSNNPHLLAPKNYDQGQKLPCPNNRPSNNDNLLRIVFIIKKVYLLLFLHERQNKRNINRIYRL